MNNKKLQTWLSELPDDYDVVFSEYTSIIEPTEKKNGEFFIVTDMPIVGLIQNNENKEIRFFTRQSEKDIIELIENGRHWKMLE